MTPHPHRLVKLLRTYSHGGVSIEHGLQRIGSAPNVARDSRRMARRRTDRLRAGASLSEAFDLFPPADRALVAAGEKSGTLPLVLEVMVETHDAERSFRAQARRGLLYPVVLLFMALGVSFLLTGVQQQSFPSWEAVGWVFGAASLGVMMLFLLPVKLWFGAQHSVLFEMAVGMLPWVSSLYRDWTFGRWIWLVGQLLSVGSTPLAAVEGASASMFGPQLRRKARKFLQRPPLHKGFAMGL